MCPHSHNWGSTLQTALDAHGSVPARIRVPLGAMSQLKQRSSSAARPPWDAEPKRMPTTGTCMLLRHVEQLHFCFPHQPSPLLPNTNKAGKMAGNSPMETVLHPPLRSSPPPQ